MQTWRDYGTTMVAKQERTSVPGEIIALEKAELVWVSGDMCRLWNVAEKSLPPDAILDIDDLPSDFGFVVLEESLESIDSIRAELDAMRIRAFTWSLARIEGDLAVHLSFYTDVERFPDLHASEAYQGHL